MKKLTSFKISVAQRLKGSRAFWQIQHIRSTERKSFSRNIYLPVKRIGICMCIHIFFSSLNFHYLTSYKDGYLLLKKKKRGWKGRRKPRIGFRDFLRHDNEWCLLGAQNHETMELVFHDGSNGSLYTVPLISGHYHVIWKIGCTYATRLCTGYKHASWALKRQLLGEHARCRSDELSYFRCGMTVGWHISKRYMPDISVTLGIPKPTVSDVICKWKRNGAESAKKRPRKILRQTERDKRVWEFCAERCKQTVIFCCRRNPVWKFWSYCHHTYSTKDPYAMGCNGREGVLEPLDHLDKWWTPTDTV